MNAMLNTIAPLVAEASTNTTADAAAATYSPIFEMIELAKALKAHTGATDPIELREAVKAIYGHSEAHEVNLDGCTYRFISEDQINQVLEDELGSDLYVLGCFNAGFIAGVTGLPLEMIEACQAAEAYEAIGQAIVKGGHLSAIAAGYTKADGYGHHFSHYNGSEEFLTGFFGRFYMFRTN